MECAPEGLGLRVTPTSHVLGGLGFRMERTEDRVRLAGVDGIFSQVNLEQEWQIRTCSEAQGGFAWLPEPCLKPFDGPEGGPVRGWKQDAANAFGFGRPSAPV